MRPESQKVYTAEGVELGREGGTLETVCWGQNLYHLCYLNSLINLSQIVGFKVLLTEYIGVMECPPIIHHCTTM